MARASLIVQSAPLREQVYEALRLELRNGTISPGARLLEVEVAARFGVSRTPVREALFQLARDGLIVASDRGFMLPADTPRDISDRLEAHLLIDPRVARHAATAASAEDIKLLGKALEKEQQAQQANRFAAFAESSYQFRLTWRKMCGNVPLQRCALMLEDQFLAVRNEFYRDPANRALAVFHDERVFAAIERCDGDAAEECTRVYMQELIEKFSVAS